MIYSYENKKPSIHENCFIAESADIIGNVIINDNCSIWFNAVIRGDVNSITIGKGSNVQDNCTIHVNRNDSPVYIGENVTIGHGVTLHGCKIGNNSMIGIGSIILDNAEVGEGTLIAAGSLVPPGKVIPSGVLCMGSPVKVIRELTEEEKESLISNSLHYVELGKKYRCSK